MANPRGQIREYHAKLYQMREEPAFKLLKAFLELLVFEGDMKRRTCEPNALPAFQGETTAYNALLKCLTTPPIEMQQTAQLPLGN